MLFLWTILIALSGSAQAHHDAPPAYAIAISPALGSPQNANACMSILEGLYMDCARTNSRLSERVTCTENKIERTALDRACLDHAKLVLRGCNDYSQHWFEISSCYSASFSRRLPIPGRRR